MEKNPLSSDQCFCKSRNNFALLRISGKRKVNAPNLTTECCSLSVFSSGMRYLFLYRGHPQTATHDKASTSPQVLWGGTSPRARLWGGGGGSVSPATLDREVAGGIQCHTGGWMEAWVPCRAPLPWAPPQGPLATSEQCERARILGSDPPITVCVLVSEACPQVQPELGEGTPGDGTAGGHPRSCLPVTHGSSFCTSESPVKHNKHLHFSKKTGSHAPTKENSWGWEPEGGSGDTALQGLLCVCVSRERGPGCPTFWTAPAGCLCSDCFGGRGASA